MGGINSLVISGDQSIVISVGQEKRITYWPVNGMEALYSRALDGENDEGRSVAM